MGDRRWKMEDGRPVTETPLRGNSCNSCLSGSLTRQSYRKSTSASKTRFRVARAKRTSFSDIVRRLIGSVQCPKSDLSPSKKRAFFRGQRSEARRASRLAQRVRGQNPRRIAQFRKKTAEFREQNYVHFFLGFPSRCPTPSATI